MPRTASSHLRRAVCAALLLATAAPFASAQAQAQATDYPRRPIRIVIGFAPGGGTDLTTRELARQLEHRIGQPVVVENRPSAGTIVAMQTVAGAAPDGYTLLLGTPAGFSVTPYLFKKVPYDASKFVPIAPVSSAANVLVAAPGFPAGSFKELLQLSRTRSTPITYGSFGVGTTAHLGMEMYRKSSGLSATHVPYKGDSASLLALKTGEIDVAVVTMFSAAPRIKSGEIRGLGVFQVKPDATLPQIQTTQQAGASDVDLPFWLALFAPPGTPKPITEKLEAAVRAATASPEFKAFLARNASEPLSLSNKELVDMIQTQSGRLSAVVKELKLSAD